MQAKLKFERNKIGSRGSSSLIIVCVTMIIILSSAVATDIIYGAISRYCLKMNAEYVATEGAKALVKSRSEAVEYMRKLSVSKVNDLNSLEINVSENDRQINVIMGKPFKYIFLRLIGISATQLRTNIVLKISGISEYKGVRPLAIERNKITFGDKKILTDASEKFQNYIKTQFILSKSDSSDADILYGIREKLKVGDRVDFIKSYDSNKIKKSIDELTAKCKHKPVCSYLQYNENCSKIIIVPVVNRSNEDNEWKIIGFAGFFIENCETVDGKIYITGRFLKFTVNGTIDDSALDFGLSGTSLIP
ncbi:MAG: hypothetical protein Q8942_18120 [Bacillota bacterium]|nr:hypothetical protein [Bacillota bacterium]